MQVIRAEGAFPSFQVEAAVWFPDSLDERLCPGEVSLGFQQNGQVVEAGERAQVLRAEDALPGFQSSAVERLRSGKVALGVQ